MSEIKGNACRIYVFDGAGTPATLVGKAFDANFDRTPRQAEHVSYDSGVSVPRKVIRYDGPLTFKCFTDPADSGQNVLRGAVTTPKQITVDYAEEDNTAASGKKGRRFLGNVTLKRGNPVDGMAVTDVTIDPDGAITEVTY
jgi:hypothetical protein